MSHSLIKAIELDTQAEEPNIPSPKHGKIKAAKSDLEHPQKRLSRIIIKK